MNFSNESLKILNNIKNHDRKSEILKIQEKIQEIFNEPEVRYSNKFMQFISINFDFMLICALYLENIVWSSLGKTKKIHSYFATVENFKRKYLKEKTLIILKQVFNRLEKFLRLLETEKGAMEILEKQSIIILKNWVTDSCKKYDFELEKKLCENFLNKVENSKNEDLILKLHQKELKSIDEISLKEKKIRIMKSLGNFLKDKRVELEDSHIAKKDKFSIKRQKIDDKRQITKNNKSNELLGKREQNPETSNPESKKYLKVQREETTKKKKDYNFLKQKISNTILELQNKNFYVKQLQSSNKDKIHLAFRLPKISYTDEFTLEFSIDYDENRIVDIRNCTMGRRELVVALEEMKKNEPRIWTILDNVAQKWMSILLT